MNMNEMITNRKFDRPLPSSDCEWWTPADLAALLGITDRAVRYHCHRLFGHRSRYRLSHQEAQRVYNFILKFGLKTKTASDSLPKF